MLSLDPGKCHQLVIVHYVTFITTSIQWNEKFIVWSSMTAPFFWVTYKTCLLHVLKLISEYDSTSGTCNKQFSLLKVTRRYLLNNRICGFLLVTLSKHSRSNKETTEWNTSTKFGTVVQVRIHKWRVFTRENFSFAGFLLFNLH